MFSFVWKMILTNEKYFPLGLSISIKPNQKYINIAISWTRRRQFPCMCINCPSISVNTVNCKLYCPPQIFIFTLGFGFKGRKEAVVYSGYIPYVNMKNWCLIEHRLHVWCNFVFQAIDMFMSSCTFFVFLSLIEYAFVNVMMGDIR